MAATKTPQELINQFWENIVSHSTNPTIITTLPQSIFAEGFQDQVPQNPGVAENVMAGYERAAEKCRAKVLKIANECRLYNQKYTDPTFDLSEMGYCLNPLPTEIPLEKSSKGDEEFVDPPDPPRMTLYVDDAPPINLTKLIAPAGEGDLGPLESSSTQPQSVKRVKQIFDKPEFFVDGATADDLRQGCVGDCWFISALSALCRMEDKELGNLVERVCVQRDEAAGVYGFVFYRDGEWRSEIVDDKLYLAAPDYRDMAYTGDMNYLLKYIKEKDRAEQYRRIVQSNSDALFFAKSAHKSETWVPLIEKAYAKAHGDFQAIVGGHVSDGIEDLTGGLATFYKSEDIVDQDKFWDEGFAKVNKSYLWGCATNAVNEQDGQGLEGDHAYAILEAETIPDGTRLVKVRNPWGKCEWEGDWGDHSPKWTDELKKLLGYEDKDDGIFWISYEDLLRNYHLLYRTRIFDASWTVAQSWTNFTVPLLTSDTYESTFKVTLSKAATTSIVLSQLDERYFRGLGGQYKFGLSFRLHKLDDDDYLYRCHHRHFSDRSVNLEVDLEAGVYEVRLQMTGNRNISKPQIEDVVRLNWKKDSRKKLLQICRSYDLAHAKVAVPELQPKAMEARAEAEAEDVTKEPAAENSNVDASSQAESSDLTSSGVQVSAPGSVSEAAKDILPPNPDKPNDKDNFRNDVDPDESPKPPIEEDEGDDEDKNEDKDEDKDDAKKETKEAEEQEEEQESKPDEPFNSVCTVGLRVYCKDAEARIEIIRPSTALLQDKQFTSSREKRLDADDPAKS